MEINIKQQETAYKEYIDNHKQNVQKAWMNIKSNPDCMDLISKGLNTTIDAAIKLIDILIDNHDASKYEEEEFNAYRKEFYPVTPEEKEENKEAFDIAWKHHYYNNLHHWNWWHETNQLDAMPIAYIIEMICDWTAMGYKFGNTAKQYYEENINKIHLGEKQKIFAVQLMDLICK